MPNQPPNYTNPPPTPPESNLANTPPDNAPSPAPSGFDYPPQPPGTALISAGMTVGYASNRGLGAAPSSGPPGSPVQFWRLTGGITWKVVSAAFQSVGGPPTLPSPLTNDNEVLMFSTKTIPANEVMADGTPIYVRTIQYFYVLQVPPADTDPLYGGVIQLDTTALTANVINPGTYIQNLLGPIPSPAGFSGQAITF